MKSGYHSKYNYLEVNKNDKGSQYQVQSGAVASFP